MKDNQIQPATGQPTPPPASKRRGLGRGLGALIVNTESSLQPDQNPHASPNQNSIQLVAIDAIHPNPYQPRTTFDDETLVELAASIKEHGVIQPVIVTHSAVAGEQMPAGHYTLVAGERRWRAARLAHMTEIPVIVREASPEQVMEWALVENVQREDLNPLEEATAYRTLMDELGLTQAEVADRVGKSRSAVANTVRLLQLSPAAQAALVNQQISAGHARTLLPLADLDELMDQALAQVLSQEMNVRQTETMVKEILAAVDDVSQDEAPVTPEEGEEDEAIRAHVAHMENQFRAVLGTRVKLQRGADGSGRLVVHFYSDSDLEHIYRVIAHEDDLV